MLWNEKVWLNSSRSYVSFCGISLFETWKTPDFMLTSMEKIWQFIRISSIHLKYIFLSKWINKNKILVIDWENEWNMFNLQHKTINIRNYSFSTAMALNEYGCNYSFWLEKGWHCYNGFFNRPWDSILRVFL